MTRADHTRDAGNLEGTGLEGTSIPEGQLRRSREVEALSRRMPGKSPQTETATIAAPAQFFVSFIAWLTELADRSPSTADDETPGDLLVAASNAGSTTTAEQELQALRTQRALTEAAKHRL